MLTFSRLPLVASAWLASYACFPRPPRRTAAVYPCSARSPRGVDFARALRSRAVGRTAASSPRHAAIRAVVAFRPSHPFHSSLYRIWDSRQRGCRHFPAPRSAGRCHLAWSQALLTDPAFEVDLPVSRPVPASPSWRHPCPPPTKPPSRNTPRSAPAPAPTATSSTSKSRALDHYLEDPHSRSPRANPSSTTSPSPSSAAASPASSPVPA